MWTLIQKNCLRSIFFAEPVEGFWPTCSSVTDPLALSKSKNIPERFCFNGRLTDAYLDSLFGMTCEHSGPTIQNAPDILNGCEELKTDFASVGDSHVRTSARPAVAKELKTANTPDCGENSQGSFAKYDRDTSSWKIPLCLFPVDFGGFLETWPNWGMMRNGECYHATTSEAFMCAEGCGFSLPTCVANEWRGSASKRFIGSEDFRGAKMSEGLRTCAEDPTYLNPLFAELVMMWPVGWTDLKPLETVRFQEWRQQHSEF